MKLERSKLLLFALLLLVVAVGGAAVGNYPTGVRELQTCTNISYQEELAVGQACTDERLELWCDPADPLNQSCSNQLKQYNYTCINRTLVTKTLQDCKISGFLVNNQVKLNTKEYSCSGQEAAGKIIMTCDSRLDGNGDGICTSGESCMQFTVDGTTVTKKEKNSRDEFVETDDSFFASRATAEVIP